jgi:hypothetical protein
VGDAGEHAAAFGGHLDVDLFGLQFHDWFAGFYRLARVLEPTGNRRLDDRLSKLWNPNLNRHLFPRTLLLGTRALDVLLHVPVPDQAAQEVTWVAPVRERVVFVARPLVRSRPLVPAVLLALPAPLVRLAVRPAGTPPSASVTRLACAATCQGRSPSEGLARSGRPT